MHGEVLKPWVGVSADVVSYSANISACEKGQQWQCALRLLEEMRSGGIAVDVISFSASIGACEKGQHNRELLEVASYVLDC